MKIFKFLLIFILSCLLFVCGEEKLEEIEKVE